MTSRLRPVYRPGSNPIRLTGFDAKRSRRLPGAMPPIMSRGRSVVWRSASQRCRISPTNPLAAIKPPTISADGERAQPGLQQAGKRQRVARSSTTVRRLSLRGPDPVDAGRVASFVRLATFASQRAALGDEVLSGPSEVLVCRKHSRRVPAAGPTRRAPRVHGVRRGWEPTRRWISAPTIAGFSWRGRRPRAFGSSTPFRASCGWAKACR